MASNFKKIIVAILIFGHAALLMPGFAFAFVSTAPGALNPVPINDSGSVIGNTDFDVPFTAAKAAYSGPTSCNSAMKTFESGDNAAQLGFSFSALIGGGGALANQIQLEINAYNIYLTCLTGILGTLDTITPQSTYTSTLKQQLYTQVKADMQTYQAKLKTAQGRYNIASQNIWKALMITILINTTKSVADQLVNKLVSNYKITNLKQYTDSVASLMYDNQFIRDNFPDSQEQMMARQILTNPVFRSQIQPGIFLQASNNLGYSPSALSPSDPDFYTKMAMAGSSPANPYFLQASYVSSVDQSHAASLSTAQTHIAQGSGYKAPVNCAGSLAQQKQIDLQTAQAQALINNRNQLLINLQTGGGSAADIKKAQADLTAAETAWSNLPYTVTGTNSVNGSSSLGNNLTSGTNTEGTAAIVMCEAISSPAVLVNQGIDAVFKSLNLGQYNNSNLPSFLSTISSIASQIGSSLVLGGIGAAPSSSVTVSENQAINNGVAAVSAAALQTVNNNVQANLANGIVFYPPVPIAGSPNTYTVTWQVVTQQIPTASYVTISGPGIFNGVTGHLSLNDTYSFNSATGGSYILTVYNSAGHALTSATQSIIASTPQQSYNYNPNGPTVAGAFTDRPSLDTRGPSVVVTPRGQ